jgi:hypothetical protein
MKRGMRLYLIGGGLLMILYLVAQYYKPKVTDWKTTYLKEDKIPFGLYILHKQMHSILPGAKVQINNKPVYNTLKDKEYKKSSYLLIASRLKLDALDFKELVKFMNRGNHVFIAATDPGEVLRKELKLEIRSRSGLMQKSAEVLNFVNPVLTNDKGYLFDKGIGGAYFNRYDSSKATILGRNSNADANFLKFNFGSGALYILPDPNIFTNYSLLRPDGATYAAKALSYLPHSQTLIWEELYTRGNTANRSILRVIFKHDELRWAYFVSLIALVVFVVFEMKRRQRIIPEIRPVKNTTMDFVKVVAKVYYQQGDNSDIARKKISYFYDYLRTNYRINTTLPETELVAALQTRSIATTETLQNLFASIAIVNHYAHVSDKQLIALNENMEEFYKQAR